MLRTDRNSDPVYSTSSGRICPKCGHSVAECICRAIASGKIAAGDGTVRISRSTKGRKGSGVTVITGLPMPAGDLEAVARKLKKFCGCGGTVKDGTIEIQGEHRERLSDELRKMGYRVKLVGG